MGIKKRHSSFFFKIFCLLGENLTTPTDLRQNVDSDRYSLAEADFVRSIDQLIDFKSEKIG